MNKYLFPILGIILLIFTACKSGSKKGGGTETPQTPADSLMAEVMEGHDAGMAKYGKLKGLLGKVQGALDSLSRLPPAAQEAAASFKAGLESVAKDLTEAIGGMDQWMESFNMDSALDNMTERIRYLQEEKVKVGKVKEAMLKSLQMADSLFQTIH